MNNIHDLMKVLSRNIYFGTEFKKSQKFFFHESLELYSLRVKNFEVGDFSFKWNFHGFMKNYVSTYNKLIIL